jgi:predicted DNA binding protein
VIRHRCDTPSCVEASHLEVGSQLENVRDMLERGRANKARGANNSKSKLTEEQVMEIRASYHARVYGKGAHSMAKRFGVSKQAIQAILSGETWAHLK